MIRFSITIFVGAFLLFQIQPLMGKYILPWFGGGATIWTTCLLFFQLLLLAGYAYAHLISNRLERRVQAAVHAVLLVVSLGVFLATPDLEHWKPTGAGAPTLRILGLLFATIGLPYFMLSSTSPLVQRWFSWSHPGRTPYRLYALSNVGSLLALLSYPVLVETSLRLETQFSAWTWMFVAYIPLCIWCAVTGSRPNVDVSPQAAAPETAVVAVAVPPPAPGSIAMWLVLSMLGSSMLLSTTNQLCQEVAVVPFLWVLPLSLYLITFVICFDNERWYDRRWFGPVLLVSVPAATEMLVRGVNAPLQFQVPAYLVVLFTCCLCCHGELVRSKPSPRYLTLFYLCVAAGGAAGGLFVAVAAPNLFLGYWEYHLSLVGCCVATMYAWYRDGAWSAWVRRPFWMWGPLGGYVLLLVALLASQAVSNHQDQIRTLRNFYGVVAVGLRVHKGDAYRILRHGRILHGIQYVDEDRAQLPTSYFGRHTGIGVALQYHPLRTAPGPADRSLRVGILGLGIGTIALYGEPGDIFRFYEINPDVETLARSHFSFIEGSPAEVQVVLGDGRIQLEDELAEDGPRFDMMVFDAFSSDAIPIHLITRECVETYWAHLKPDGLLVFNISNRFVDLTPVVRGLAEHFDCEALFFPTEEDLDAGQFGASWVILTRNRAFLETAEVRAAAAPWPDEERPPLHWTDDFASLWRVLRW